MTSGAHAGGGGADPLSPADFAAALEAARGRGLHFAPIRHHSPACAAALRAMIRAIRPAEVLVEGPPEYGDLIPLLLHPETQPPVALVSLLGEGEARGSTCWPVCAHSPEYVALQEGAAVGARLGMIDAPAAFLWGRAAPEPGRPAGLADDGAVGAGRFLTALARRAGCRDGAELWDHLFESRLSDPDWAGFFADVGTYCAAIRAATPAAEITAEGHDAREAAMMAGIAAALARADGGPVLAVIGGFHLAPLIGAAPLEGTAPRAPKDPGGRHLVGYGHGALDALTGYGAGLPSPGWYARRWEAAGGDPEGDPDGIGALLSDFAGHARAAGRPIPLPAQVELLRMARGLAGLRGRAAPQRQDVLDAAGSALAKGAGDQTGPALLMEFLRGQAMGRACPDAGAPPLLGDLRRRAEALGLDLSTGEVWKRRLDIRRKAKHLALSRFLHGCALVGLGMAERLAGPDFLSGRRTDLLFEEWRGAWSHSVEIRAVEAAALGDDLPAAGLGALRRRRAALEKEGKGSDPSALFALLPAGLLAGLGPQLAPLVADLAEAAAGAEEFSEVAAALAGLVRLGHARGPLAPGGLDLSAARAACMTRLVYLCDDLPRTPPDLLEPRLQALRLLFALLRGPEGRDVPRGALDAALDRAAAADPPPQILGAVLAAGVEAGRRDPAGLVATVDGALRGSALAPEDRLAPLHGALAAAPGILARSPALIDALDRFLAGLAEADFLEALPHLRLALAGLPPAELQRLAERIAARSGGGAPAVPRDIPAAGLRALRGAEAVLAETVAEAGLEDWLFGPEAPVEGTAEGPAEEEPAS